MENFLAPSNGNEKIFLELDGKMTNIYLFFFKLRILLFSCWWEKLHFHQHQIKCFWIDMSLLETKLYLSVVNIKITFYLQFSKEWNLKFFVSYRNLFLRVILTDLMQNLYRRMHLFCQPFSQIQDGIFPVHWRHGCKMFLTGSHWNDWRHVIVWWIQCVSTGVK